MPARKKIALGAPGAQSGAPGAPAPNPISEAAAVLGRRGAGVPKNFSAEERARRAEHMKKVNAARRVRVQGRPVAGSSPGPQFRTVTVRS